MEIFSTVLTFIIILLLLVIIHEFGHYFLAKKMGVFVEEFGFGFPPRVFWKKIGETIYSFNIIPLGGFVKLYQEEYHEVGKEDSVPTVPENRGFVNKKPWQKVLIVMGGVMMNFLLGWIIISYLFTTGVPSPNGIAVQEVQPGSPASKVGLSPNDKLLQIKVGRKIIELKSTTDLIQASKIYGGLEVVLLTQRGDEKQTYAITPRLSPPKDQGAFGIVVKQLVEIKQYPWYKAHWYGLKEAFTTTKLIMTELVKIPVQLLTTQKTSVEFSGPVGIAKIVGQAKDYGFKALLELTALLSLNLAVFNILPFPALDGGRLVFIIYEWITGRRSNQNLERYMNMMGIILLLSLSVLVTINDLIKLWG